MSTFWNVVSILICWQYIDMLSIPHICQGHQGRCPWRKKLSCGEICPHDRLSGGEILHMTDCQVEKFSTWQIVMWKKFSTWEMWRKSEMWRNNVYNLWCFVAFYAVLSRNLFCHNLRAFAWSKIEPKIVPVEKNDKYQVCESRN